MKQLIFIVLSGLLAGNVSAQENGKANDNKERVSSFVRGDFNGDGRADLAVVVNIKEGQGNPVEDGTPDEYEIRFPNSGLNAIRAGCCAIHLINEGDLNKDGADELSLVQAPMNGCTYSMTTYALVGDKWNTIVPAFLIPTGCDPLSDADLQKRVFAAKGNIYYLETDMQDEEGGLKKKKVSGKD